MARQVAVVLVQQSWAVKWADSDEVIAFYRNQTEAEQIARALARREGAEVSIHGRDGRVTDHRSYART